MTATGQQRFVTLLIELAALSGGCIDPLPERLFEIPRKRTSGIDPGRTVPGTFSPGSRGDVPIGSNANDPGENVPGTVRPGSD